MIVLLIEDNSAHASLIMRLLPLHVFIVHVYDGEEALATLEHVPLPTLILLDLQLPRLGGLETLLAIRNHREAFELPVVIMSTSDSPEDVQRAYEAGASDYIVKPYNLTDYEEAASRITASWLQGGEAR